MIKDAEFAEWEKIQWKKPFQFMEPEFRIFDNNMPSTDDIKQGGIGNCYFLSALTSLAKYPELIGRIFDSDYRMNNNEESKGTGNVCKVSEIG
jgi:hypothetical protein